jgi:membrane protein implicated in regulation of membrane protease activity
MGFGTGGLVGRLGLDWPVSASALAGLAFGAALVWLLAMIMKSVYGLESDGNVDIHDTVGREAIVEAAIPGAGAGSGRVRVIIDERMRSYDAVTEGEDLASQTRVRVLRANHDNTLTVGAIV